jgi:ABC-type antimicrobial peptide transport system permease subunit
MRQVAAALLVAVGTAISLGGAALLMVYAVLLVAVCAAACALPVRRALRIEPTQALASDA